MSDIISTSATGVTTPVAEVSKPKKPEVPTLKLLYNRTHIGPTTGLKVAKTELSKATGKVLFNNQLKVKAVKEKTDSNENRPMPNDKVEIPLGTDHAVKATKYFLAWDKKYKGAIGSSSYQKKYTDFLSYQRSVYEILGISVSTDTKGKTVKPELTEQQRGLYNEQMRKFAFSYYETRISYKVPGVKAVRTLTYRTLKQPDLSKIYSELKALISEMDSKIQIVPKTNDAN